MFSFLNRKKLPISFDEQIWIEDSFIWLISQFGYGVLKNHKQLQKNSAEYLLALQHPDGYAEGLLCLICMRMEVDRQDIELVSYLPDKNQELVPGLLLQNKSTGAAGLYQQTSTYSYRISYDETLLKEPEALAAVLAHEVGHVLLLGQERMNGHEEDHELMTDFVSLYFGFGILAANAMHREYHTSHSWSSVQQGYLSMPMYSFALALVSWIELGKTKPLWLDGARLNVKSWFKQSIKYLSKTGKTSVYSNVIAFDEEALPSEVMLIKKQLKLALLLEDYRRASKLKNFLEEKYFTKNF